MKPKASKIILNVPQMITVMARQLHKYLILGRGGGKSTIIAHEIKEKVTSMPRSTNVMVGETYKQMLTTTLPSTIRGLEMFGLIKDRHYFVGRRPPRSWDWPEPYEPPLRYSHFMIFWTGAGYHLVSQDREGTGRGLNTDSVIGDEAALLDRDKLNASVLATNRGNLNRFGHLPGHHSTLFASTLPATRKGQWLYDMEEEARKDPESIFFLMASSHWNKHNLGAEWFKEQKRVMTDFMYSLEIENKRPRKLENGFYALLDDNKHYYSNFDYDYYDALQHNIKPSDINCLGDRDVDPDQPLILSIDWGGKINCATVCQFDAQANELKFVKSQYVKHPRIIDHLINEEFVPYYAPHRNKSVELWYDRSGNDRVANSQLTYAEQTEQLLVSAGWSVQKMTAGGYVSHGLKYLLWNRILKEDDHTLPAIRINKYNCSELIISLENAPARDGPKGIEKVKTSERKENFPQEEATHFSDAADNPVCGMFLHLLETRARPGLPAFIGR